jgi:predicted methyltransferase
MPFTAPIRPLIRMRPISRRLIPILAIALFAWTGSQAHANPPADDLAKRLAEGDRSSADKARDAGRQPAEVITFLGIEAGMTVMDLIAAGGYYTEVLSEAVGPKGHVYAQNGDFVLKIRDGANDKAMRARLANDRLPNVERLDREIEDLTLDGTLDAVLTALNFHDIYNGGGAEAANKMLLKIRKALRPGGVLGLIDHAGDPKADNEKLHRIDEAMVVEAAKAAGFVVEASSELLRHPEDDRTQFVFAKGLRGATDRFVLRLRKPR